MSVDLIYKMHRDRAYEIGDASGFFFAESFASALRTLPIMVRDRGPLGALKLLVKVVLGRAYYFGLTEGGHPLSTGVAARGYCRFYPIAPEAVVLGEIVTDEKSRGRGYATRAIMLAINAMIRRGRSLYYIDTQTGNAPMIRAIEKLGFGPAIAGAAISGRAAAEQQAP